MSGELPAQLCRARGMPFVSFRPKGAIHVLERKADPDERSEIRVTADGVMVWGIKDGRCSHFYLSGRATLQRLAAAIEEQQGG